VSGRKLLQVVGVDFGCHVGLRDESGKLDSYEE
jgi:hypothetical protein